MVTFSSQAKDRNSFPSMHVPQVPGGGPGGPVPRRDMSAGSPLTALASGYTAPRCPCDSQLPQTQPLVLSGDRVQSSRSCRCDHVTGCLRGAAASDVVGEEDTGHCFLQSTCSNSVTLYLSPWAEVRTAVT